MKNLYTDEDEVAVYDGRVLVGTIRPAKPRGAYTAETASGVEVGIFDRREAAVNAVIEEARKAR